MRRYARHLIAIFILTAIPLMARAPYGTTDTLSIANAQEIREAQKNLGLGSYCFKVLDYTNAEKFFKKAAVSSESISYPLGSLTARNNLGVLDTETGRYSRAWSNLSHARATGEKAGLRAALSEVINNIAFLVIDSGMPAPSGETPETLLAYAKKLGPDKGLELVIGNNEGLLAMSRGDLKTALKLFTKIHKTAEKKQFYQTAILSACDIGDTLLLQGLKDRAVEWYAKALNMSGFWDYQRGKIAAQMRLGALAESKGEWAQALLHYKAVRVLHQELKASSFLLPDEERLTRVKSRINP